MQIPLTRRGCLGMLATAPLFAQARAAAPAQHVLLVFNGPLPGQEDAYNDWYNHQHMRDVVSVPGFVRAQRFKLATTQLRPGGTAPASYVVRYDIVTDHLAEVFAEVDSRLTRKVTKISATLSPSGGGAHTFTAIGPRIFHPGASGDPAWQREYLQLVYSNPTPGMEAAYNEWYDHTHLPQVVGAPDFVSAQRFKSAKVQLVAAPPTRYLAMFEIGSDDFAATVKQFQARAPGLTNSKAFDGVHGGGYSYQAIGPAVSGDEIRAERFVRAKA